MVFIKKIKNYFFLNLEINGDFKNNKLKQCIRSVEIKKEHIILDVNESVKTSDINRYFFEKGIVLSELREIRKSLEDQFLEITKK